MLHPTGYFNSGAFGVSGVANQAGYATPSASSHHHALMWSGSAGSVVDLHPPDFPESEAFAAAGGQQVGRVLDSFTGVWHGFVWGGTAASGLDLNPVGFGSSEVHGTNGTYQVGWGLPVGPVGHHAVAWMGSHDHAVDINPTFCTESFGAAISSGTISVGYGTGAWLGTHAIRWGDVTPESGVDIHPAGYAQSQAFGTSGMQDVGTADLAGGITHAALWNESGSPAFIDLHPAGLSESGANAVADGVQVGYGNGPWGLHSHALRWTGSASGSLDLHAFLPPSFLGSIATGIDAAGNIVGVAEDGGATYAILWVSVPAPSAGATLGAAMVLATRRRRGRVANARI